MRRREFLRVIGGGAAAWPVMARAQQTKTAKLGFVSWMAPTRVEALREGLRDLGYVEGQNIEIEVHFVDSDRERTRNTIQSLMDKGVDVLIVRATPAAHIAKQLTQTIPIVMIVADALSIRARPELILSPEGISPAYPIFYRTSPGNALSFCARSGPRSELWPFSVRRPIQMVLPLFVRRRRLRIGPD